MMGLSEAFLYAARLYKFAINHQVPIPADSVNQVQQVTKQADDLIADIEHVLSQGLHLLHAWMD